MSSVLSERIQTLSQSRHISCLQHICHGLEKEGLRVTPDAGLSLHQHPRALGSALMHPYITTDYSESLLEFITPVYEDISAALHFLEELHQYTISVLPVGEYIWNSSMPAVLKGDQSIPIARYGDSNIGKMKHIYRQGLSRRYGSAMQTIAGIHYNFSLPESFWMLMFDQSEKNNKNGSLEGFISEGYFSLIRNFKRYSWMLVYLFGASPAFHSSFLKDTDVENGPEIASDGTCSYPWATSLRMSDIGYTNQAQASLDVCYNSLEEYISTLSSAIHTSHKIYEKIGIKTENGRYQQLNTNLLQIENEYYSAIRPKRIAKAGETPLHALKRYGVEYVEVRCLDINPFLPVGIDEITARFMDTFLLFCTLQESPHISRQECLKQNSNFDKVVNEGRRPGLLLSDNDRPVSLKKIGTDMLSQMMPVARLLDTSNGTTDYSKALELQNEKFNEPDVTPSARVLTKMSEEKQGFISLMSDFAREHSGYFNSGGRLMDPVRKKYFKELVLQSHKNQHKAETEDLIPFDQFLDNYFKNV